MRANASFRAIGAMLVILASLLTAGQSMAEDKISAKVTHNYRRHGRKLTSIAARHTMHYVV